MSPHDARNSRPPHPMHRLLPLRRKKMQPARPAELYRLSHYARVRAMKTTLPAPGASPANPAQSPARESRSRKIAAALQTAWWRLGGFYRFGRMPSPPPLRLRLLLLLDPAQFVVWPARYPRPSLTLPQRLGRVWVRWFPPAPIPWRPDIRAGSLAVLRAAGHQIPVESWEKEYKL